VLQAQAPITSVNFLQYVEDGYYDGTIFHRVAKNFVVQGGGYTAPGAKKPGQRDPITLESTNQTGLSNTLGTVAMARTNVPNSATSEFFFNFKDNSAALDYQSATNPGYAVFGNVTEGMDVVNAMEAVPITPSNGPDDGTPVTNILLNSATLE
jgi:peptidyl-prolyl cis-trans isomerase A (cyclophilin A)